MSSDVAIAFEALANKVHSPSDFIDWFLWIPLYMRIFVGAGTIGVIAVLYIFIVAAFTDKHY